MKKFIAPGSWFSFLYPDEWYESEGEADEFLFFNPDVWNGNVRISASRDRQAGYADACLENESQQPDAQHLTVGRYAAVRSSEVFEEGGHRYVSYYWTLGDRHTCVWCTFTTKEGSSDEVCRSCLESLVLLQPGETFPEEVVEPRLLEIERINQAYETMEQLVRRHFKKAFTDTESSLQLLQQLVDRGLLPPAQQEVWEDLGLTFCALLEQALDGFVWRAWVNGAQEEPLLCLQATGKSVRPLTLFWEKQQQHRPIALWEEFSQLLDF